MKKMTKRMLSMFLAAVLVFTTVPFSALVAFAKRTGNDAPTSSAYLTNGIDDAFTKTGEVSWDSTEKAAYFNGGTLSISNFNALSNVSSSSAFAVSFDFKKTSANPTYGFVFQLDSGIGSNQDRFGFNAGGSDDHRGLTYATINNSHNVYWSQDFGASHTFLNQNNGSWGTSWKPENDTWYNVALFMAGGELQYYLNGNWIGTFNAPSEGSLTNAQIMDNMKNLTTLFVGKSSNSGDGTFRGYVKNLQFFSYAQNDAPSALKTAIDAYEAKMADGKVYKNLSNAYAKYQQASARYDAYIYGESDPTDATVNAALIGATQELTLATGAMQPWVEYSGTKPMYSGTIATGAYSNVLYAPGQGQGAMSFSSDYVKIGTTSWTNNKHTAFKGWAPSSAVFYYNGDLSKIYFPVGFEAYANSSSNRTVQYVDWNGDANVEVTRYWYGYQQGWNNDYGVNYDNCVNNVDGSSDKNDGDHVSVGYSSSNTKNHTLSKDGDSKKRYWVNIGHIKALSSNTLSKTSLTMRMKTDYGTGTNAVSTGIYVVNYYQLTQAIKNNKSKVAGIDVTNYKEGGLATALSTYDIATSYDITKYKTGYNTTTYLGGTEAVVSASSASAYYNYAQGACTKFASDLGSIATPAVDTNYKALKDAIDYEGQIASGDTTTVLFAASKSTSTSTTDGANNGGYIKGLYKTFILKYNTAVAAMAALSDKTAYPTASVATTASDLTTAFSYLNVADITKPTVSPASGRLLGPTDTVTITNPEAAKNRGGHTTYNVAFSDSSAAITGDITGSTATATITPFSGKDTAGLTATVTAQASAVLSGDTYSMDSDAHTYTLYSSPSIADTNVNYNEGILIESTNAQTGTIQYSLDGSTWSTYNASNPYVPFSGTTASSIDFYVRETKTLTDDESQSYTVTSASKRYLLERNADFDIKAKYGDGSVHSKGASYYDENSTFWIDNAGTYTANITYSIYIDGVLDGSYTYDSTNGIAMTSAIQNASFIKIIAFATDRQDNTIQTEKTLFNATNFSPLLYQESFDKGDIRVLNGNLVKNDALYGTPSGTISIEKGAGTKSSSTESYSWRNNVLKINANSTKPGPVLTMAENPISVSTNGGINAAAVKSEGVTIAFWRHMENSNGDTVKLSTNGGDPTGYNWRNAIAFQKENDNTKYYIIEVNGVNSRSVTSGTVYTDVVPNNQDNTNHEEGNDNGEWEHVAVTIHPTNGIHVYTNGVEHDYMFVNKSGAKTNNIASKDIVASTSDAGAEILDFLTQSDTQFTLDNGVCWEGSDFNLYLDDIRIYAGALKQVDINNMYTDEFADVQTNITSTSHDPTTVTVFTLDSGFSYTVPGGSSKTTSNGQQVGQEFIDYYNVPDSKILAIDYYSFGTGMTVYKAGGTEATLTGDMQIQWNVLGDSEGRCGYQNQDLFGGEYTTALAQVITAANFSAAEQNNGAGHLVWAPHVMYNLVRDEWVYYASMSSWGSLHSATFMCTSSNPIKNYTYNSLVYQSNVWTPNAIDMSAFYGRDSSGNINPDELYMTMGSWNWDGRPNVTPNFGAIYGMEINSNGTAKYPDVDSMQTNGTQLSRAYMQDLERAPEGQGSCEGSFVQYIYDENSHKGYYYLFVSFGQNEGSYTERVFRSENPLGPYAGTNGVDSNTGEMIYKNRGNQILSPFDISIYTKTYRSTGHNSVYKAKNADGDWVWVNAVHARPYASKSHNWTAVQDNALAKRQSGGVTGNVSFNNMLGVTEHGWLVMFPYQYNGTDSVYKEVKASDLEGLYAGNNMRLKVDSEWGKEYQYTILANLDDETNTTGVIFGTRDDTEFRYKFKLVRDASGDKVQYIRIYNDVATYAQIKADTQEPVHEGVIGVHIKNGKQVPMMATLDIASSGSGQLGMQYWAYRMGNIPDVDKVISHGDFASMDGVIYTHATDAEVLRLAGNVEADSEAGKAALASGYAVYGQEISNNYTYGQNNYASGGERYTTLTTKFPASIDVDKIGNIISLNDTEYCRNYGETGSNMRFVNLTMNDSGSTARTGWWCTKNANGTYTAAYATDEEAIAAVEANPSLELYKVYGIEGKVSSFFRYYDDENDGIGVHRNGYPKVGVTLVVAYTDVQTGAEYSEFEFCYVMPNPAWAHTLAAIRNSQSDAVGNDRQSSYGTFNRFVDSYGSATDYYSSMLYYAAGGTTTEIGDGHGVSGYLTDFESSVTSSTDLKSISKIKTLFNFYDDSVGVNSGSFSTQEHKDDAPNSFIATPDIVDVNYYFDYSDTTLYDTNRDSNTVAPVITTSGGIPTGYKFNMKTNNFLWDTCEKASIFDVTSYARNTTGLNVSYSSKAATITPKEEVTYTLGVGNDGEDIVKNAGIMNTNRASFATWVAIGGYRRWFADEMLFHTDDRKPRDSLEGASKFYNDYRNRYLYWFTLHRDTNGNLVHGTKVATLQTLKNSDNGNIDNGYIDGSTSTKPEFYDYSGQKAYTTGSNGKDDTNNWWGIATFTGKDRVTRNTYSNIKDYYYYYNVQSKGKKEHWTSNSATAQAAGSGNYGDIDVSAENYANYILEMGSYHKVSDTGVDGGRFIGKENYHYYNIGVATCDKGAARDFMENFALKRLVAPKGEDGKRHVTLDADGRPTVDTNMDVTQGEVIGDAEGNLYVEDISAKSYRDYIDALARLEWFVNNPTNTVQNDLAGEDEYEDLHSVMTSGDEYVTAYNGTTPIYVTSNGGSNVFKDAGVTVNTDQVQAKLIADVIEAYEHLYTVEDYKEVEKEYKAIKEEIDAAKVTGDYTKESIDDYEKNFKAIEKAVAYYTDLAGLTPDTDIDSDLMDLNDIYDEDYWRYSDYSGADYDTIREALEEIKDSLMPKVVTSELENTSRVVKTPLVRAGIYTDGTQTLRYDQWAALYNKIVEADGVPFDTGDGVVQTETGKARYATTETKSLNELLGVTRDESDDSTKLDYNVYRLSSAPADGTAGTGSTVEEKSTTYGATYVDIGGGEFAELSENQTDVNTENKELSDMNIGVVDDNDAYQSYNAAYTIVNSSINKDKYIASAQAKIDEALATRASVYTAATADQASTYATVTGNSDFTAGTELKITGTKETDPITADLLTLVSVLEADNTYVKQFGITYDVTKNGANVQDTQEITAYYGDTINLAIPSEAQANSVFSITYYDGELADAIEHGFDAPGYTDATGSTKATVNGSTFSRVVKSNMAVTAKISNKTPVDGQYTVRIRNIYGTVIAIYYCAKADLPEANTETFTIGGETVKPEEVPFYTFSSWEKVIDDENKTADYTAKYNAGDSLTLAVEGNGASVASGAAATAEGATTYTTTFDTLVTLGYSGSDEFAAWATVIDDGGIKYQIASYSPSYSFYAVNGNGTIDGVTGEKFVPVVKVEGKYKVGETELTAANVDTVYDVTYDGNGVVTADKILYQKLADKAPFVTTVGAQMSNDNKAATVYCRVTEGYNVNYKPSEIALLARSKAVAEGEEKATMVPSTAQIFKTSTILSTGQFVYTISKSSAFARRVLFRGYITYDFNYKFTGTNTEQNASAKLNIAEYSDFVAQATLK